MIFSFLISYANSCNLFAVMILAGVYQQHKLWITSFFELILYQVAIHLYLANLVKKLSHIQLAQWTIVQILTGQILPRILRYRLG